MNFYSSDAFCDALAASYFPNQTVTPELYKIGKNVWRIPTINATKPLTQFPLASQLIDFYEPYRVIKDHGREDISQQAINNSNDSQTLPRSGAQENHHVMDRFLRNSNCENAIQPSYSVDVTPNGEQGVQTTINTSSLKYLPRVNHGLITSAAWDGLITSADRNSKLFEARNEPAPTVIWNKADGWRAYQETRKEVFSELSQGQHKLEQELGALSFTFDESNPEALLECIALKSKQHQSTDEVDLFAQRETVQFFQEMAKRKLITVSSLRVGQKLLAANICATDGQCLYYWIPAYDDEYHQYAPGMLLLGFLLEESFKQGYEEFDFLLGNESYKWMFATHTRLISAVGRRPILQRPLQLLKQVATPVVLSVANQSPKLKVHIKSLTQKLGV